VTAHLSTVTIEPGLHARVYWADLWRYRELLAFLAWRDIAVRYKQTLIGFTWALLKPGLTMLVFVLFRKMVGIPGEGVPDALLVLAAVLPWQFFSGALTDAAGSLVGNSNLISKVYFPRLLVPLAAGVVSIADFAVTLLLLAAVMAWYGFWPSWQILTLPLFVVLALAFAIGMGLLLAALNVRYRDFRYIVPFIVQFGLFVSPIAFTTGRVPEAWRTVFYLNPLVGVIDGFRWAILAGKTSIDWLSVVFSTVIAVIALALGIWYFRRTERTFADII
jgi:lipopolysaccharide transport system permease protein